MVTVCLLLKCYQHLCLVLQTHTVEGRCADGVTSPVCHLLSLAQFRLRASHAFVLFLFRMCSFVKQNRDAISRRSSVCSVHSLWVLLSISPLLLCSSCPPHLYSPLLVWSSLCHFGRDSSHWFWEWVIASVSGRQMRSYRIHLFSTDVLAINSPLLLNLSPACLSGWC